MGATENRRRYLIAERLPTAGGKDDERVAPIEACGNRFALERSQLVVTPELPEGFFDCCLL